MDSLFIESSGVIFKRYKLPSFEISEVKSSVLRIVLSPAEFVRLSEISLKDKPLSVLTCHIISTVILCAEDKFTSDSK